MTMKIYETKALVISEMPIQDYDKRIVLFTKDYGKITAFVKNARKPKSPYLTTTQMFGYCHLIYTERKNYVNIQKMELIDLFHGIREDITTLAYGMYMAELLQYTTQEYEPQPEILLLTLKALKALEHGVIDERLVRVIYELKLLSLNGLAPELRGCQNCGQQTGTYRFSVESGGLLCSDCSKVSSGYMSEGALYTMRYILSTSIDKLFRFKVSSTVLQELQKIMEGYVNYHIDGRFKSLELLQDL